MAKLHEVLAVEDDLKKIFNKILAETTRTFSKKGEHFFGHTKTLEMFDDKRQQEADALTDIKDMVTTVPAKLEYMSEHVCRFLDAVYQKEASNQNARADVVLKDGTTLIKDVPATMLLALERELRKIREVYELVPTHPPGRRWELDESKGKDVYTMVDPITAHRTEKSLKVIQLAKATKEHKEQIHAEKIDVPIGQWTSYQFTGTVTPARKSQLLDRIDALFRAVKEARMRANEVEIIVGEGIGKFLFDYING